MKLKKCLLLLFIFMLGFVVLFAQNNQLKIQYVSQEPIIDGKLDANLDYLRVNTFSIKKKSNKSNPNIEVRYRFAYSVDFFYVHIEVDTNTIIFRDRGYQNGDGFHMVLAKSQEQNKPTDEFYVLACSAVNNKKMEWSRHFFWYYNVTHIFKKVSNKTKMQYAINENKIGFELLIPWQDLRPLNPFISNKIGFNLCFVKGVGNTERNFYKTMDVEMGGENCKREYCNLIFEKPKHIGQSKSFLHIEGSNILANQTIKGTLITASQAKEKESVSVIIKEDSTHLCKKKFEFTLHKGINVNKIEIKEAVAQNGNYSINWKSTNKSEGSVGLTCLTAFNKKEYDEKIEKIKNRISISSYHTLKFRTNEIDKKLKELKSYETSKKLSRELKKLNEDIKISNSKDEVALKKGFVRKAYLSKVDASLQPYVVYLPVNYQKNKKYPLLVYLHGSASDETNIISAKFIVPEGFIGLAPFGRGTSNCYSWNHAQDDIKESIQAVLKDYSIDQNNIILSGFSMGGYGVYRTFYQNPSLYKGLAIFSGHPNLANKWTGTTKHPNFLEEQNLSLFKNVPIFIFHGQQDRNCSFAQTQLLVDKLDKKGAKIQFISEKDKGHSTPNKETIKMFYKWLNLIQHMKN